MTTDDLKKRLLGSASALGWDTEEVPDFVAKQFRGRLDASGSALPTEAYGLRLGAYPVIVAPIILGEMEEMKSALRLLHSQLVIARSYMSKTELINAHIFMCVVEVAQGVDWRRAIDVLERDESVCRKIVWMPESSNVEQSYEAFLARTFLASPWRDVSERHDASLDRIQGLAELLLVRAGLPAAAAPAWIAAVESHGDDVDAMIDKLVRARGETL
ncbi:MAG: ABC-three component system middle component 1 [Stenotrophomonas sp.]